MSTVARPPLWAILLGFPVAIVLFVISWGLIAGADTGFGVVWGAFFAVVAVVVLVSDVALLAKPSRRPAPAAQDTSLDDETARFLQRRPTFRLCAGMVTLLLLGAWSAVMGVVGAIEESWIWLVIGGLCAIYLLGFPVLAAMGRFRSGGVWLTPTRIVDEHLGVLSQIATSDIESVLAWGDALRIVPRARTDVRRRRRAPRIWTAGTKGEEMVVLTDGAATTPDELAAHIHQRMTGAITPSRPGGRGPFWRRSSRGSNGEGRGDRPS